MVCETDMTLANGGGGGGAYPGELPVDEELLEDVWDECLDFLSSRTGYRAEALEIAVSSILARKHPHLPHLEQSERLALPAPPSLAAPHPQRSWGMLALSAPPLTGLGEQLHGGAGQGTGLLGLGARPAAPPRGEDGMVRSVALVLGGSSGQCPTSSPEALHGGGAGSTDKKRKGWREAACEFLSSPPKGGSPNGRREAVPTAMDQDGGEEDAIEDGVEGKQAAPQCGPIGTVERAPAPLAVQSVPPSVRGFAGVGFEEESSGMDAQGQEEDGAGEEEGGEDEGE
ncbi:hypothetical protein T484DRAFT_1918712, partial [Baffinella frigidus]